MGIETGRERDAQMNAIGGIRDAVSAHSGSEVQLSSRSVSAAPSGRVAEIVANSEEVQIGDADLAAVRDVIASLGARGSSALDALTVRETISLIAGLEGLSAAMSALQARSLVHLEAAVKRDSLERGESARQALKVARIEASRALKRSRSSAGQTMSSCRRLVASMPRLLADLAAGRVTPEAAHRVGRVMGPASPAQRSQVDEFLAEHLPYLQDCGPDEVGGEAEKLLHALDPIGAGSRHRVAKRERCVTVRRAPHGMSTVTATLSGLDGARIRKGLSIAAEKARSQGDRRGHQQIMADLFADTLIGRGDGLDPCTLEIGVIITDRSLFAPAHADAATIEGFGPVPYEHIREEMHAAMTAEEGSDLALTLRRLYADQDDGHLVAIESRSRAFPPALARFLRLSHLTCRAPHCDASIRQNDHIVPFSQGGATSLDNGNGLCAADNQKEESGETVRVIRDANGNRRTVEWTTRYGQKASRRAINFDPLGTALRQREKAQAERQGEREGECELGPRPDGNAEPGRESDDHDPLSSGQHVALRRALTTIVREDREDRDSRTPESRDRTSSPPLRVDARPPRHWIHRRRRDFIFDGSAIIVSSEPWVQA